MLSASAPVTLHSPDLGRNRKVSIINAIVPETTDAPRRVMLARSFARARTELPLVALDAILIGVAYLVTMCLRFDMHVPERYWHELFGFLPIAMVAHLASNSLWGLYQEMWLHASVREARRVV